MSSLRFSWTRGHTLDFNIILNVSGSVFFAREVRLAIATEMWWVAVLILSNKLMQSSFTFCFCPSGRVLKTSSPVGISSSGSDVVTISWSKDFLSAVHARSLIVSKTTSTFAPAMSPHVPCMCRLTFLTVVSSASLSLFLIMVVNSSNKLSSFDL